MKVETGPYASEHEVIETALGLLDARDERVEELRRSIEDGFASIERGEVVEFTLESMEARAERACERVRRGEVPSVDVCP